MAHRFGAAGELCLTQPLARRWLLLIVLLPWSALALVLVSLRVPVRLESPVYQSGVLAGGERFVALQLPAADLGAVALGDAARITGIEGGGTQRPAGEGRVVHRGGASHEACRGLGGGALRGDAPCVVIALVTGGLPAGPDACAGRMPWPRLRVEMTGKAQTILDLLNRPLR